MSQVKTYICLNVVYQKGIKNDKMLKKALKVKKKLKIYSPQFKII
jgi:hypothetical protein